MKEIYFWRSGWLGVGENLKLFLSLGLMVLLAFFAWLRRPGVWPDGLLDAYVAMIPKSGGGCHSFRSEASLCFACASTGFGLLLG